MSQAFPGFRAELCCLLSGFLYTQEVVLLKASLSNSGPATLFPDRSPCTSPQPAPLIGHSLSYSLEFLSHAVPFACLEGISSALYPTGFSSPWNPAQGSRSFRKLRGHPSALPCSRGPLSVLTASRSRIPFFLLVSSPHQTLRTPFWNRAGAAKLCVESTNEQMPAAFPLAG